MNNILETLPEVQAFMERIRSNEEDLSVVLVGSVARHTQSENSDIDLLVVSKRPFEGLSLPSRVHLMHSTYDDFLKQLENGEDFEAWSVRLGVVVHDNGLWSEILIRPESKTWPSWQKKVVHGARRLFLANKLIETGDLEAATEEMLYAVGHIARGLLLKADIFPLSRPELEDQIEALGYPHIASIHRELRTNPDKDLRFLLRCQAYSKRLLVRLSADDYKRCAAERRKKKRSKQQRRRENAARSA
jgi:predicted nucleotidyltransferase